MSDRKTISISPDLFTFKGGNNTTRKKKSSNEHKDLKIKSSPKQTHPKTLKNRLLHYIRKNQEQNFKKIHGGNSEIPVPDKKSNISHITDTFNTDFQESMKYMNILADEVSQKVDNEYMINRTLRNYKSMNPESILTGGGDFNQAISGLSSDDPVFTTIPESTNNTPIKLSTNTPQWGCMKGGTLPTYKTWLNQTHKNRNSTETRRDFLTEPSYSNDPPKISLNDMSISSISSMGNGSVNITGRDVGEGYSGNSGARDNARNEHRNWEFLRRNDGGGSQDEREPATIPVPKLGPGTGISSLSGAHGGRMEKLLEPAKISQIRQTMDKIKLDNDTQNNKLKYGKRKKTVRRTYKLGKSHTMPKVSVLISNKTVRKNISTKTEKLKHTPIEEIRTILIKKGFIKVGSLATNDVLRKMYESMVLVCGEVENHNPDNLLYNYFNS
jgi:hypothetical protein